MQSPVKTLASDCSILLHQAGVAGAGTITSTPAIPSAAATDASSGGRGNTSSSSNSTTGGLTGVVEDHSSGLSTGAKAGIGIGVACDISVSEAPPAFAAVLLARGSSFTGYVSECESCEMERNGITRVGSRQLGCRSPWVCRLQSDLDCKAEVGDGSPGWLSLTS